MTQNLDKKYIDFSDPKVLNEWIIKHSWDDLEAYLHTIPQDQFRSLEYMAQGLLDLYKYNNLSSSLRHLENSCKLSPYEPRFLNTYSDILLKAKNVDKAFEIAKQSVSIEPNNCMSNVALTRAALAKNDYDTAYNAAKSSNQYLPDNMKELKQEAQRLIKKLSPIWWQPLVGKNIQLVRISSKHKEFLMNLRQNTEFQHHYNLFKSNCEKTLNKDIAEANKPPIDLRKIEWIIEKNEQPIGIAGLVDLDVYNGRAEIQFGIPNNNSSSYGVEAVLLLLEFAFSKIKLHKLVSYVYSDNPSAQKNTLHLGFTQEGFLESHIYDKNFDQRLDLYVNRCLANEFFNNQRLIKMAKRLLGRDIIAS